MFAITFLRYPSDYNKSNLIKISAILISTPSCTLYILYSASSSPLLMKAFLNMCTTQTSLRRRRHRYVSHRKHRDVLGFLSFANVPFSGQFPSQYPKLLGLESLLQKCKLAVIDAIAESGETDKWHISAEYPTDVLLELARYINFHDYHSLSKGFRDFNTTIHNVFRGSLGAFDGDLGNVGSLRNDEIDFIRRACHVNSLSGSLFALLTSKTACSKAHNARMHLSGFLGPGFSIDLLVAGCEEQSWHLAKCRWFIPHSFPPVPLTNKTTGSSIGQPNAAILTTSHSSDPNIRIPPQEGYRSHSTMMGHGWTHVKENQANRTSTQINP